MTASGFEDGFGRRVLAADREEGTFLERLYLRPEFGVYEHALRDAIARVAAVGDERIVAPRGLERDSITGELVLVSPFASGDRLSDLIELAHEQCRDESIVPGIDVGIGLLLEVLPILDTLRARAGLPHGALSPSRLILSPAGRLVIVEAGFSAVLQRLNLHRGRLWNEFRIAMPPVAGAARFDSVADIAQATLAAVALALGRPLDQRDTPEALPDLMAETIEIAQLRGSVAFAIAWQRFLQRALPLPGRRLYESLDAALRDVRQLASAIGGSMCSTSLLEFARQMNVPAGSDAESAIVFDRQIDVPPAPVQIHPHPEPSFGNEEFVVALDSPPVAEPVRWEAPERAAATERLEVAEPPQVSAPEPVVAVAQVTPAAVEPLVVDLPVDVPQVAPVSEPAAIAEPVVLLPSPLEVVPAAAATAPQPEPVVHAAEPDHIADLAAAVAELDLAKPSSRRRRARGERHDGAALRSSVAPPPTPAVPPQPAQFAIAPEPPRTDVAPAPSPVYSSEPIFEPPATPKPVPTPVFPTVNAAPPAPVPVYSSEPIFEPPPAPKPVPQPVFPTVNVAPPQPLWEPPRPANAPVPVASVPLAPIPLAAPSTPPATQIAIVAPAAPVRIKTEAPAGYVGSRVRHEPPMFSAAYSGAQRGAPAATRGLPWKAAAAAAVLLVGIFAAGRVYVPDRETLNAEIGEQQPPPKTVPAPVALKTGILVVQSQPAGARVLLDGGAVGQTPLRIEDVAPGRHVITLITSSATVKRTVRVDAGKTATVDVPVFSGWVAIFAPVVLEVSEEGRSLGTTEQDRILLPPGRHTLTLTNRALGFSTTQTVDVQAGEVASLNIQPRGSVNLNAQPWAEVWIDGKKAGETPIANLELPLGTREIIFRHPEFGERRVTTTVRAGSPAAVSVDFTK